MTAGCPPSAASISRRRPGASGSGTSAQPASSSGRDDRLGRQADGDALFRLTPDERGKRAGSGQPASRPRPRRRPRSGAGDWIMQHGEPAPAALRFARGCRLLLRMALGRGRRKLVDVGEDRLGKAGEDLLAELGGAGGFRHPPPGDPGADAVGSEERLHRSSRARLATADAHIDLAPRGAVPVGLLDQVDELGSAPARRRRGRRRRTLPPAAGRRLGRRRGSRR